MSECQMPFTHANNGNVMPQNTNVNIMTSDLFIEFHSYHMYNFVRFYSLLLNDSKIYEMLILFSK